jgi:hypothetical protein
MSAGTNAATAIYDPRASGFLIKESIPTGEVVLLISSYIDFFSQEVVDTRAYALELFQTLGNHTLKLFETELYARTTLPSKREVALYRTHVDLFRVSAIQSEQMELHHPWLVCARVLERVFVTVMQRKAPIPTPEMLVDYLKTVVGLNCMYIKKSNRLILEIPIQVEIKEKEISKKVDIASILTVCLRYYRNLTLCVLTQLSSPHPVVSAEVWASEMEGIRDVSVTKNGGAVCLSPHQNEPLRGLIGQSRWLGEPDTPFSERDPEDTGTFIFEPDTPLSARSLKDVESDDSGRSSPIRCAKIGANDSVDSAAVLQTDPLVVLQMGAVGSPDPLVSQTEEIDFRYIKPAASGMGCYASSIPGTDEVSFEDIQTFILTYRHNANPDPRVVVFELLPSDSCLVLRDTAERISFIFDQSFIEIILRAGVKLSSAELKSVFLAACLKFLDVPSLDLSYIKKLVKEESDLKTSLPALFSVLANTGEDAQQAINESSQDPLFFLFDELLQLGLDPNAVENDQLKSNLIEVIASYPLHKEWRANVALAAIDAIMKNMKKSPLSPELVVSMYIYFPNLLTETYRSILRSDLIQGLQSKWFKRKLAHLGSDPNEANLAALNCASHLFLRYQFDLYVVWSSFASDKPAVLKRDLPPVTSELFLKMLQERALQALVNRANGVGSDLDFFIIALHNELQTVLGLVGDSIPLPPFSSK